ncbi:hypothetical protein PHK61_17255 [Actinomycetospora lutea]|nr:hypothetical protein [Actinomycetospora lutea]MDD7940173.1 hypothetical protein [Actinomycetospora lutea]
MARPVDLDAGPVTLLDGFGRIRRELVAPIAESVDRIQFALPD